jgi:large subunit ribosomal protein L10e
VSGGDSRERRAVVSRDIQLTPSGQVIMSIRCRDQNKAIIIEALRRARYKFPGRQKIIISKKWGFTSLDRPDYEALKAKKLVVNDGAYVQFLKPKGNLEANLRMAQRA